MTMKKLIRKILRESHDMDWVEDTNLSPYHGVKFTVSRRDYGHPLCSYFILYDAAISDSHTGVNKELVNKPRATYGESYYVYCDYEGNEEPTANGLKGLSMYSKEGIDDQFDKGNWIRVDNAINEDRDMEWIENTNPVPLGEWDKPREGKHLMCLPGFQNRPHSYQTTLPYGGAGYEEGKVITVDRVSGSPREGYIIWPAGGPNPGYSTDGIYAFALARI